MIKAYDTALVLLSLEAGIAHERCLAVKIVDTRNYVFFGCLETFSHMPYGMIIFCYCTSSAPLSAYHHNVM